MDKDIELISNFGYLYERVMALRKNDDYVVNTPQMAKFLDLVTFFLNKQKEDPDIHVEAAEFQPKEQHGGVTATFIVADFTGDEVLKFTSVLSACSAITIDATTDFEVRISCTVPYVFISKDEKCPTKAQ